MTGFLNAVLTEADRWSEVANLQDSQGRTYHVYHWYHVRESKWIVDDLRACGEVLFCMEDGVFWGQTWSGHPILQSSLFWSKFDTE